MTIRLYAPGAPEGSPGLIRVGDDRIEVILDGPPRLVAGEGRPRRLLEVDVRSRHVGALKDDGRRRVVYADRFDARDLDALREREWCGIDRCGQVVIASPRLAVVVARPRGPVMSDGDGLSVAAVRGVAADDQVAGVRGATTARLTQLILEAPGRISTPTGLAEADGLAAAATSSRLLADLARLGLVSSIQRSRTHGYRLVQPTLLARWLAERTRRPHPDNTLPCYARGRDADALVDLLAAKVRSAPYSAVLTGPAAAAVEGASVTTSLVTAPVRVEPDHSLAAVVSDFGLTRVSSGANVLLIKDVGRVGTLHHRLVDGVPIAGVVRTWLDLRSEPRGADAGELYFDHIVGPAIGSSL